MKTMTTKVTSMGHGGSAIAKGKQSHTIFVPYAIPDETVKIELVEEKRDFSRAELVDVIRPSTDRVTPKCQHYGVCGGCHFQHVAYERQLALKTAVTEDQLNRIGKLKNVTVHPTLANPTPWAYRTEIEMSPVGNGRLGFWSPKEKEVIPIDHCDIAKPILLDLLNDIDLDLPGLRKLTLKVGEDDAMLAALEVDDVEPPELEADFPVSVSIVLPNRSAAALVGDHFLVQEINGRSFHFSPGCYQPPSIAGMELVIQTVLKFAHLQGSETVLDLYSGVGMLTAFLAEQAKEVVAVEWNRDAVADAIANLDHLDNVSLYEDQVETGLAAIEVQADVAVINPTSRGMSRDAVTAVLQKAPARIIMVNADIATTARDGKALKKAGYQLLEVQPIDMEPQTFHVETVMLWENR